MQAEGKLKIHRVVMINPPVSLFSSVGRLDRLFAATIGPDEQGVELLYTAGCMRRSPICIGRRTASSWTRIFCSARRPPRSRRMRIFPRRLR